MKDFAREEKGFISLVGVVIALCIVCFLCFIVFKTYFKNPTLEQITDESHSERIIDVSNYQSIVESSRAKIEDYNEQVLKRQKQLEEFDR